MMGCALFGIKRQRELFECSAREARGKTDFETMPEAAALSRKEDEELVKTGLNKKVYDVFYQRRTRSGLPSNFNNFTRKLSDGRSGLFTYCLGHY